MDFEIAASTTVDADPGDVFDLITDIDRLPVWNREVRGIHERPSALVPGAEWVVEIRAMGTHWRSRSTVVDLDRDAGVFAYRSRSDDGNPSTADWVWRVAPRPDGTTHVAAQVSVRPRTFLRRYLFSNVRKGSLRNAVGVSLDALRALATSPTAATTKPEKESA